MGGWGGGVTCQCLAFSNNLSLSYGRSVCDLWCFVVPGLLFSGLKRRKLRKERETKAQE